MVLVCVFVGVFVCVFVGVFVCGFVGLVANRGQLYTSLPKIAVYCIFGRVSCMVLVGAFVGVFVGVFVDVFVGVFVGGFVGLAASRGQLYTCLPKIAV